MRGADQESDLGGNLARDEHLTVAFQNLLMGEMEGCRRVWKSSSVDDDSPTTSFV